jgi:integrase
MSPVVCDALARQLQEHPARTVEILDRSDSHRPQTRSAELVFTTVRTGRPVRAEAWGKQAWMPAVAAVKGVPHGFGLHGLRHYYATLLIHAGASVKTVQLAMGHANATTTLNEYTHEWPDLMERTRTIVECALGAGAADHDEGVS